MSHSHHHHNSARDILGVRWTPLDTSNIYRLADWYDGITSTKASKKPGKANTTLTQYLPPGYLCVDLLAEDGWVRSDLYPVYTKVDPTWGLLWSACENVDGRRTSDGLNPLLEFRVQLPNSSRWSGAIPVFGKVAYNAVFHKRIKMPEGLVAHLVGLGFCSEKLSSLEGLSK